MEIGHQYFFTRSLLIVTFSPPYLEPSFSSARMTGGRFGRATYPTCTANVYTNWEVLLLLLAMFDYLKEKTRFSLFNVLPTLPKASKSTHFGLWMDDKWATDELYASITLSLWIPIGLRGGHYFIGLLGLNCRVRAPVGLKSWKGKKVAAEHAKNYQPEERNARLCCTLLHDIDRNVSKQCGTKTMKNWWIW
jgi:hypothetical protein